MRRKILIAAIGNLVLLEEILGKESNQPHFLLKRNLIQLKG